MRKATMKIRSQRGASITFALLLFLMCAMASAVAIVSATAAGGRLAKIAETDQRYYAVNSAANFLKAKLDGEKIVFVENRVVKETKKYDNGKRTGNSTAWSETLTFSALRTPSRSSESELVGSVSQKKETEDVYLVPPCTLTLKSPLVSASCELAGYTEKDKVTGHPDWLQVTGSEDTLNTLKIKYKEVLDKDNKTLKVYLWKTVDGNANLAYTLCMTFVADVQSVTDKHDELQPVTTDSGTNYQELVTTTEKVTTVKWELVSINKASIPTTT